MWLRSEAADETPQPKPPGRELFQMSVAISWRKTQQEYLSDSHPRVNRKLHCTHNTEAKQERRGDSLPLPDFASRRHAPASDHFLAPHEKRFVVHVDTGADVIGHNGQHITDSESARGFCNVQVAVLFVELDEGRVGRLDARP